MELIKSINLTELLPKVKQAALDSSKCLLQGDLAVREKGPNDFITRIDMEISEYLCAALPKLLPASRVISEERKNIDTGEPCRWIIDPIDGTNNLVYGLPFYAVSIGLVLEKTPVLGVVYLPATGELFSAAKGSGAFVENTLIPHGQETPLRVNAADSLDKTIVMAETDPYFDRRQNRSIELIRSVYEKCIDCRITGSAAIDMSYIAAGRAGVHFCQNLNPWDYAGGGAILIEAGGKISQWDGSPVTFEGKHSSLATNGLVHEEMLKLIGTFLGR
jgi:myo-inositol-1(or 4)-monophosphatase